MNGSTISGTDDGLTVFYYDSAPGSLPGSTLTCRAGFHAPIGRLTRTDTYEPVNNVLMLVSKKEFCYDIRGRITAMNHTISGRTYSFSYTYNEMGLRTTEIYPDGDVVSYFYDDAGKVIASESSSAGALLNSVQYSAQGLPAYRVLGDDQVYQQWCYEEGAGLVPRLRTTIAGDQPVSGSCGDLGRGGVDNVSVSGGGQLYLHLSIDADLRAATTQWTASLADPTLPATQPLVRTVSYSEDGIGRLQGETFEGVTQTFAYDAQDNMVSGFGVSYCSGRDVSCAAGAAVSGPHQLNSTTGGDLLSYDAQGNVSRWVSSTGVPYSYTRNYNGQVRTLARYNGTAATIHRGVDGDVVAKFATTVEHYPGDGYRVRNFGVSNRVELNYGPAIRDGSQVFFRVATRGDSTGVLVSAANGDPVQAQTYGAFGELREEHRSGSFATDQLWQNKELEDQGYDADDPVYDFGPRSYAVNLGRWLTPDVVQADGLNRYAYVGNRPHHLADPSGRGGVPFDNVVAQDSLFGHQFAFLDDGSVMVKLNSTVGQFPFPNTHEDGWAPSPEGFYEGIREQDEFLAS
ncbi:MAG: RHS repeat-associated core domain-containing protein, partial [Myxococcota bacterium]